MHEKNIVTRGIVCGQSRRCVQSPVAAVATGDAIPRSQLKLTQQDASLDRVVMIREGVMGRNDIAAEIDSSLR